MSPQKASTFHPSCKSMAHRCLLYMCLLAVPLPGTPHRPSSLRCNCRRLAGIRCCSGGGPWPRWVSVVSCERGGQRNLVRKEDKRVRGLSWMRQWRKMMSWFDLGPWCWNDGDDVRIYTWKWRLYYILYTLTLINYARYSWLYRMFLSWLKSNINPVYFKHGFLSRKIVWDNGITLLQFCFTSLYIIPTPLRKSYTCYDDPIIHLHCARSFCLPTFLKLTETLSESLWIFIKTNVYGIMWLNK